MVDKDELLWLQMNAQESQEAAYIKKMQEAQQLDEYRTKCFNFVEEIKRLRTIYPNDQMFGEIVADLLKTEKL